MDWIKYNRQLGIAISVRAMIGFAISIINEFQNKKYKNLVSWAYRFMKRNNLVFRLASHIGQKLSSKAETQLKNFLKDIITKRNNLGIFEDIERLVNVDESPIYLEMPPKKTIEIKGSKNVDIYTFGKEKYRITSVLSITASGSKLPSLLIFKGKAGKYLEKKLNKLEEAKNKEIFISCQENSWCTYQLFLFWLRNIFHYYQKFVIKKNVY